MSYDGCFVISIWVVLLTVAMNHPHRTHSVPQAPNSLPCRLRDIGYLYYTEMFYIEKKDIYYLNAGAKSLRVYLTLNKVSERAQGFPLTTPPECPTRAYLPNDIKYCQCPHPSANLLLVDL